MPANPSSGKREVAITVMLWAMTFLALVVPFWIIFLGSFRSAVEQNRIIRTYVQIDAMVISSRVTSFTGSKGRVYYKPDIQYQYDVDGRKHHAERVSLLYLSGDEAWAQDIVTQYPPGKSCHAWYDPQNPTQAVLIHRYSFDPYKDMLMGAFILSGGLFFVLQLWFMKKYEPAPLGDGWFEIKPKSGERQRLFVAKVCAATWYGFGAVPAAHYFLCVPPPYSTRAFTDFEIFAAIGLIPIAFLIHYWRICRNQDEAQLRIDRPALSLGQPFNFVVTQRALRELHAKSIRVQLFCIGVKVQGKSRSETMLYESTPVQLKDHPLREDETLELPGKLTIPPGQSPSGRDATGKYNWINWSIDVDCKFTHAPGYNVSFPLVIQPPVAEEPAVIEKPRESAQILPVPPEYAGRIGTRSKMAKVFTWMPMLVLLLGFGMMVPFFLVIFPNQNGAEPFPNLSRQREEVLFALGGILVVTGSVVGIVFPMLLGGSYTYYFAKKEIQHRRDAIVMPEEDSLFAGIVPRSNWNKLNIKTSDVGFLAVDTRNREIQFEGDKERYRIPAGAILSCKLEKSFYTPTARPNAPGIWLVVTHISTPNGTLEVPFAPYLYKTRMSTKLRQQAAQKLHSQIEALLPEASRQPSEKAERTRHSVKNQE